MPIEREISFNQLLLQCLRLRVGLQENQLLVRFLRTLGRFSLSHSNHSILEFLFNSEILSVVLANVVPFFCSLQARILQPWDKLLIKWGPNSGNFLQNIRSGALEQGWWKGRRGRRRRPWRRQPRSLFPSFIYQLWGVVCCCGHNLMATAALQCSCAAATAPAPASGTRFLLLLLIRNFISFRFRVCVCLVQSMGGNCCGFLRI